MHILSLDIERDFHGTVQQAILAKQQREATCLEIDGLRHDAEMNAKASQMALEEVRIFAAALHARFNFISRQKRKVCCSCAGSASHTGPRGPIDAD